MSRPNPAWWSYQSPMKLAQVGRRRLVGEAQEDEALPGLGPDGRQAEGLEAEVVEVLGVLGPEELPVEVVDPGVVGALEADGLAALPLLHRGAPMAADVVEGADHVVAAADEDHALAEEVAQDEAPRLRQLLGPADRDPVPEEDVLDLPGVDLPRRGTPDPGGALPSGRARGSRRPRRA